MSNRTIYLAGPINGRTDADCKDWRADVRAKWDALGGTVSDPMDRDYRGQEATPEVMTAIVEQDKQDIKNADGLIVYTDTPSDGTAMEVLLAWQLQKPVVIVNMRPGKKISPWMVYHAKAVVSTVDEALMILNDWL